jgi:hypothetical protein|tara:strand:+ start:452 stop:664 length:213 start_codon:yes stop_codon:yes gene_type:complete
MSNVTALPDIKEDNSDDLFEELKGVYRAAFVLGWNREGYLEIRSSSSVDTVSMIYMMEVAKIKILSDTTE